VVSRATFVQLPGGRRLDLPEIQAFCESNDCHRVQHFAPREHKSRFLGNKIEFTLVYYACRNCARSQKVFALALQVSPPSKPDSIATMMKLGEFPPFGPPAPSRLLKLTGGDRALFLKGRQCENQGLGIGAFGYYRRVVEYQKGRLFDELIQTAERLGGCQ